MFFEARREVMADSTYSTRVRDISKEIGVSVKEILDIAYQLNIYAKTGYSPLGNSSVQRIREHALELKRNPPLKSDIRISDLSKELGTSSKETVDIAVKLSIPASSGCTFLKHGQAERIRAKYKLLTLKRQEVSV